MADETNLTAAEKLTKAAAEWRSIKNTDEGAKYCADAKLIPVVDPATLAESDLQQFVGRQIAKLDILVSKNKVILTFVCSTILQISNVLLYAYHMYYDYYGMQ